MDQNQPVLGMTNQLQIAAQVGELQRRRLNGVSWFYWVAGLSVLNTLIVQFGGDWSFIFGLGLTQVVDAVALSGATETAGQSTVVGFVVTMVVAGLLALVGYFGQRGHTSALVYGMCFYALDAVIFAVFKDYLAIGFHVLALIGMGRGLMAQRELVKLEAAQASTGG